MADALLRLFRASLPLEVAALAETYLSDLEQGCYQNILQCPEARILFGHEDHEKLDEAKLKECQTWNDLIFHRLGIYLADRSKAEIQAIIFCIGYAALLSFVQSNVTGPPLPFDVADVVLTSRIAQNKEQRRDVRQNLLASLTMDGVAAYKLTPNVELLCLADAIMTHPAILKNVKAARWAKVRTAFFQQRLLSEVSSTLQEVIYDDLDLLEDDLASGGDPSLHIELLLERSTIHIHHGLDKFAREDLEKAKAERQFQFALVGMLGRRTKFQEKDVSQLVVLAKSHEGDEMANAVVAEKSQVLGGALRTKPENLNLNDDTLLESISFTAKPSAASLTEMQDLESLPVAIRELDPASQPQLQPLDATILLLLASSITNTSPQNGLTREETLPYATRVLEGSSSNWQVYTQALLIRSRIEGYRSRTTERGLLQLQALVDQVIADTTSSGASSKENAGKATTTTSFLPRAKESESAPVSERLKYIFQLATPTRWELESELASRWVQLGGLRSALEIYERLELWAEAALCWAATDREDKAKRIVRRQLFHATKGGPDVSETDLADNEEYHGPARHPAPLDAPRLYCILGDIDADISMYEQAWKVSNERYARAQRSLGRYFYAAKDMVHAAEAYSKSLRVNQLNHRSWFALGCALLELEQYTKAVESFSRCVQLDETDAEAWSNLAAALLRTDPGEEDSEAPATSVARLDDEDDSITTSAPLSTTSKTQQVRADALKALKRAASLKHDSHRIWENVLVVSASLHPPDYQTILASQRQIIKLRGPTDGEKCIDVDVLSSLVNHIMLISPSYDAAQPGLARMVVNFIDQAVIPLITSSATLWQLVSKLALWRNKPSTALSAEESAWRVVTNQPGWDTGAGGSEERWNTVVEATIRLCDSYESLGPKEKTEGLAAGSGEVVMKEWKFKSKSAVRGIMGRAKDSWEGTDGWDRLKEAIAGLTG